MFGSNLKQRCQNDFFLSLIVDTVVDTVDFVAWPESVNPPASSFLISRLRRKEMKKPTVSSA